jgi:hypothetical protein
VEEGLSGRGFVLLTFLVRGEDDRRAGGRSLEASDVELRDDRCSSGLRTERDCREIY